MDDLHERNSALLIRSEEEGFSKLNKQTIPKNCTPQKLYNNKGAGGRYFLRICENILQDIAALRGL
jgi:hypothetical protein